jgi:predicted nucleic acid-binding Zn ribbon protein
MKKTNPKAELEVKENTCECIVCRKEIEGDKDDFCDSCSEFLSAKHPKTKFKEVKKWHKKNARELREWYSQQ